MWWTPPPCVCFKNVFFLCICPGLWCVNCRRWCPTAIFFFLLLVCLISDLSPHQPHTSIYTSFWSFTVNFLPPFVLYEYIDVTRWRRTLSTCLTHGAFPRQRNCVQRAHHVTLNLHTCTVKSRWALIIMYSTNVASFCLFLYLHFVFFSTFKFIPALYTYVSYGCALSV